MGVYACDPDKNLSSDAECGPEQAAGENEGVSIFFGRSTIESVKSLAGRRCNSIPKQYQEDLNKNPSPGSVARKAAFFDQYIRTLSLEKSTDPDPDATPVIPEEQEQEELNDGGDSSFFSAGDNVKGFVADGSSLEAQVLEGLVLSLVDEEMEEDVILEAAQCSSELDRAEIVEEITAVCVAAEVNVDADLSTTTSKDVDLAAEKVVEKVSSENSLAKRSIKAKPRRNTHENSKPGNLLPNGTADVTSKWNTKNGLVPSGGRALNKALEGTTRKMWKESATAKKPAIQPSKATRATKNDTAAPSKEKPKCTSGVVNDFHFRSNDRAEKRKEFNRKMEEKLSAKEAEKTKIQAKTEEEMQAEIKELRRALNFKATPMPGFYQPGKSDDKKVRRVAARVPPGKPLAEQAENLSVKTKKTTSSSKSKALIGKASAIAVSS